MFILSQGTTFNNVPNSGGTMTFDLPKIKA